VGGPPRRVTAADIARVVGVSRATVGFVLNDTPGQTISEETRRRVLNTALRMGYRPNVAARALARGRSDIVLLVLPNWPIDYSLGRFIEELSAVLDSAGYSVVTWAPRPDTQARPLWERVDADLVIGLAPFEGDQLASLRAAGVTKIYPTPEQRAEMEYDHTAMSAHRQAEHLYALGHQRLAYATPADPRRMSIARDRVKALRELAARRGMPPVVTFTAGLGDESTQGAVRACHDAGCTGVVAYNDEVAAIVVGAALRAGIAVPGQLSVIGHDDSPIAAAFLPALTTVRLDLAALGRQIGSHALRELGVAVPNPEPWTDVTEVVERESTTQRA
jgi:DNA-binding LacI/PurR family transcriptional regulator